MGAIDSLFVELMLDPTQFIKGSKDATNAFKKTKEEAAKSAKDMEASSARASQFFKVLAVEAGGLFSVIAGANSLKQFIVDVTASNAASGRLAQQLNISTNELTTMEAAAKLAGGSTDGMAASIQGLIGQFQQFSLTGESSIIPYFRLMKIAVTDAADNMRPLKDIFADMAAWGQTVDPAKATSVFKGVGLDPGTITMLLKGKQAFLEFYEAGKQYALTPKQAEEAQDLTNKWSALELQAQKTGNTIAEVLNPPLEGLLKLLGFIVVGVDKVAGALKNLDHGLMDNIADAAPDAAHDDSWFGWRSKIGTFRDLGREKLGLPPRGRAAAGGSAKGGGGAPSDSGPNEPTGPDDPLKKFIMGHEGAGYNVAYGNAQNSTGALRPPKPITQMTIAEILEYQHRARAIAGSSAFPVGRAQWVESTLRGLTKDMDPNTIFTPEVQERLFDKSIAGRMGQGPNGMRAEWDSLRGVSDEKIEAAIQAHRDFVAGIKKVADNAPSGGTIASDFGPGGRWSKTPSGAALAARASTNNSRVSNSSSETNIGEMHVHTQATDGAAFAQDFKRAKDVCSLSDQANSSLR